MNEETRQLLWEAREVIADLCDDNGLPYPMDIINKISIALDEYL